MNWLFLLVILIIIIFIVRGWRRGLLRLLFSLVAVILLIVIVAFATPHISNFFKTNTNIYTSLQTRTTNTVKDKIGSEAEDVADKASESMSLPSVVSDYISGAGENLLDGTGIYDAVGGRVADFTLAGIAFLVALIAAVIVIFIIGRLLKLVNKIPVIGVVNRVLGIFGGLIEGYIAVSIGFLFIALISNTNVGGELISCINGNSILQYIYYDNVILKIFSLMN